MQENSNYESNIIELIEKFEKAINTSQVIFFDEEELEQIIDYYFEQNDLRKTTLAIDLSIQQYPYQVLFPIRKAQLLAAINNTKEALHILAQAEVLESSNTELFMTRAAIYSQMGLTEQSIENYRKALEHAEDKDEVYLYMAYEFIHTQRHADAIFYLKKALKFNPNNDAAIYELGFCYEIADLNEEALLYFNQFIDANPYIHHAWFNLGVVYNRLGLYEKAIDAYDFVIAIKENFASAYFNKGNSLAYLEKYDEAIEVYKQTFEYEEADATTYYYMGECFEKKGDGEKALSNYNKAVKLDPMYAEAWMGIGLVLEDQNRLAEGIHYIKKALDLEPENADFIYIYGEIQEKLGFFEEAEIAYKKVSEINPEIEEVWLDYSNLLFEQNRKPEALETMAEGIKHHPQNADFHYRMAAYLISTGEKQEALKVLQHALDLNYDKHSELLTFLPTLKNNSAVLSLIESYRHH